MTTETTTQTQEELQETLVQETTDDNVTETTDTIVEGDNEVDNKTESTGEDETKTAPKRRGRPPKTDEQKEKEKDFLLGIYKLNEHTKEPEYGTTHSACFDIRVNLKGLYEKGIERVSAITRSNQKVERKIEVDNTGRLYVDLRPHERLLAPTGAIFDIPVGYSLKVHPRSGTSLKQGINLINQEGVIDADYVEELFLPLVNSSENHVKIYDDERYAQGELQEVIQARFDVLTKRPSQKSERTGGFGHTGVK